MVREASNVHLTKMRSVPLIRCLPKMPPSSSTSTGSQIVTWRRSLTRTRHEFGYDLLPPSTGKMFVWPPAFLVRTWLSAILPHRHSQLSDLTIRLHITTSLKSISQKWWLYHHSVQNGRFDQFNFINVSHVTNHSSSSLVKSPSADLSRYGRS